MTRLSQLCARLFGERLRARDERGFTMVAALGVLSVVALLSAAAMATVMNDAGLTRADLDGKQAYAAAQAGLQAYMYNLNNNSSTSGWWQTCGNDAATNVHVPGAAAGVTYSYTPVPANSYTACSASDPVGSLIDRTTGTLRMEFTGTSRTISRTIVATLQTDTPLKYLWYTIHETEDPTLNSACAPPVGQTFWLAGTPPDSSCWIYWVTGDWVHGPAYTQDEFLINSGDSPQFGRDSTKDLAEAQERPSTAKFAHVCVTVSGGSLTTGGSPCQGATFHGLGEQPNADSEPFPSSNQQLASYATSGGTFQGTTNITLHGDHATVVRCNSTDGTCSAAGTVDLKANPLIYVKGTAGCGSLSPKSGITYSNQNGSGNYYGTCGDVYVSGTYSLPVTITADDDIVITGDVTTSHDSSGVPNGTATLGLVAGLVRVWHKGTGTPGNPARRIDAAIVTTGGSFMVDNYGLGGSPGTLTVYGAIAQEYRGIVGQIGTGGYLKDYHYDDRLHVMLPPFMFALVNTSWSVIRETLCRSAGTTTFGATTDPQSCAYTGT